MTSDLIKEEEEHLPKRACPVCGGVSVRLLFHQSFEWLDGVTILDGYDVVVCRRCGAGYADGIPPQAAFDAYYRDMSKYDEGDQDLGRDSGSERRFQDIAAIIARVVPGKNARIFEIGCASGGLLNAIRQCGFPNVLGSDPSPACIRSARKLYAVPGVVGTIFTVPTPAVPFDFLILTGVLEHIRDLELSVAQFHRLLENAGRVYLEVPDASRYLSNADAPFQEFSIEHINFFSQVSLINLMEMRGFRVLETGHALRSQHEIICPCTYGVFEKSTQPPAWKKDTETEVGLRAYIDGCRAEDARIRSIIRQRLGIGERMIVWGAGTHTLRLLATGGLDPSTIALFVDSNPQYQGKQLCGIQIVSPDKLGNRLEPILISSRGFQHEIRNRIQHQLLRKNPVIVLYDS